MINNDIHLSFIPEDLLIKSINKNDKYINTKLNLNTNNEIDNNEINNKELEILVPGYYETMFLISTDTNKIYTIEDI